MFDVCCKSIHTEDVSLVHCHFMNYWRINYSSDLKLILLFICYNILPVIGADILDSTGQNVLQFGSLEQEDTWFELSPQQRLHFDGMRHVNSYLREEFHAIQELLWRSGQATLFGDLPKRSVHKYFPWKWQSWSRNWMIFVECHGHKLYRSLECIWHSEDRALWYILIIKPTRCTNFSNLFLE